MKDEAIKVQRTTVLIKVAMATVILIEAMAFQKTNTLNFGSIAMTLGILCLLRGLLLSPYMLSRPVRVWFKQNVGFTTDSRKYFLLSFILLVVGSVRYV